MSYQPPLPGPETPGEGLPEIVPGRPPVRPETGDLLLAVMGDTVRTGRWPAPRHTRAVELLGNLKLDLREVVQPGETLEVEVYSFLGDVRVLVPPGTDVQVRGATLLGDARTEIDAYLGAVPVTGARVVLTAYSFIGNVRVRTMATGAKLPRGWRWAKPR